MGIHQESEPGSPAANRCKSGAVNYLPVVTGWRVNAKLRRVTIAVRIGNGRTARLGDTDEERYRWKGRYA